MASTRPSISIILWQWAPVIFWAALIFVFSTEIFSGAHTGGIVEALLSQLFPRLPVNEVERIHTLIRKLGHLSEYFVFALLLMRALRAETDYPSPLQPILLSVLLTVLYAASDEFHQSFVPSRSASVADVMIDAVGGICGALLAHLRNRRPKATANSP
jgi:VanZ family protein